MSRLMVPFAAVRALGVRALVLWALVHALYVAVLLLTASAHGAAGGEPLPATPNPLWVTGMCTALLLADVRRRGERALWGNLGISRSQLALLGATIAALGETLLAQL